MEEFDFDLDELGEEDKRTEEEIRLVTWGFPPYIIDGFRKREPNEETLITKKGNPKMNFFRYFLDSCTLKDLEDLREDHLTEKQKELLKELREKLQEKERKPLTDSALLDQYIEKNSTLMIENEELRLENKELRAKLVEQTNKLNKLEKYKKGFLLLANIFREQGVKAELSKEEIELIKELYGKDGRGI